MAQLSWPERFEVVITPAGGSDAKVSYNVLTWLHEPKAVALATAEHLRRNPDAWVYDVTVTPLGAAPRSASGTVEIGSDLHDRYEF